MKKEVREYKSWLIEQYTERGDDVESSIIKKAITKNVVEYKRWKKDCRRCTHRKLKKLEKKYPYAIIEHPSMRGMPGMPGLPLSDEDQEQFDIITI